MRLLFRLSSRPPNYVRCRFRFRARPFYKVFREPNPADGKRFHFYALCLAGGKLLFFGASDYPVQVLDTAVIAGCARANLAAFPPDFPTSKAYTSYMCNQYAIFTIHCIKKTSGQHCETKWVSGAKWELFAK